MAKKAVFGPKKGHLWAQKRVIFGPKKRIKRAKIAFSLKRHFLTFYPNLGRKNAKKSKDMAENGVFGPKKSKKINFGDQKKC